MNPILLEIFFPDYKPPHEIVRQTYDRLFEAIRPVAPEVSASAWKAWNEDRPVGLALAGAIRAWGEQIRVEEREKQKKLEARLETQVETQEKQLDQQAKDIRDVQKDLYEMDTQCVKLKQIIAHHVETIQDQRNLLAKQYERLARLSGLPKDE